MLKSRVKALSERYVLSHISRWKSVHFVPEEFYVSIWIPLKLGATATTYFHFTVEDRLYVVFLPHYCVVVFCQLSWPIGQLIICRMDGCYLPGSTDRVTFTSLARKSSLRRSVCAARSSRKLPLGSVLAYSTGILQSFLRPKNISKLMPEFVTLLFRMHWAARAQCSQIIKKV